MEAFLKKLEIESEGGPEPDRWINNDIKPIEEGRRTWGFWTFHNFCMGSCGPNRSNSELTWPL